MITGKVSAGSEKGFSKQDINMSKKSGFAMRFAFFIDQKGKMCYCSKIEKSLKLAQKTYVHLLLEMLAKDFWASFNKQETVLNKTNKEFHQKGEFCERKG